MNIKRTLTLSMMSLLAVSTFSFAITQNREVKYEVVDAAESIESYYSSITDDMEGDTLLNALNSLNNSKRKSTVGYNGMKTFAKYCDADPDGSGKIIGFYDNAKIGPNWDSAKTWNREHVWPNARGGGSVEGDAHMPRPASVSTNSDRGSKGFSTDSYDPGKTVAYYRGVASRIIFYCAIANKNLKIIEDPLNYDGSSPANSMGRLSDMLLWNLQYLPSDTSFTGEDDLARRTELNRNEVIQTHKDGQGNRNPFIDHPEYACRIWGNTNDKTRAACSGATPVGGDTLTSITIVSQPTKKNYKVGESLDTTGLKVNATLTTEEGVTSTVDVTNKVTFNITTFTTTGTIKVVVSYTYKNVTKTADMYFNVTEAEAKPATNVFGCQGNIVTTSIILSSVSFAGIIALIISKSVRKKKKEQ